MTIKTKLVEARKLMELDFETAYGIFELNLVVTITRELNKITV